MKKIVMILLIIFVSGCVGTKPVDPIKNVSEMEKRPQVVDMAISDLAKRLNAEPTEIHVINFEKMDWPDASLGFSEEGMMYAQVITPGYLIMLRSNGKTYEYHSDLKRIAGPKET